MHEQTLGFAHFISQADGVAHFILAVLLLMSVATWYLIITKAWGYHRLRRESRAFLQRFWEAPDLKAVVADLAQHGVRDPYSHLVQHALQALDQHHNRNGQRLIDAVSADELLTRALRRAIEQDTARLEYGHTVLASVASSAPFVGLFGTVWGIYHALIAIGLSGQGTLDRVAGPVGEALIMTALGLAVAIPAVLAYNAFTRANRMILAELDGFAHDLFAFLSTGSRAEPAAGRGAGRLAVVREARMAAGGA
ncbi:MAG: MotA/TolQ/ExbB proton channel family protein [Thiobacillaceae bacterium]|nr:MotA/TolQ/ExbB proton channel family protein [Thiobacillaceae bacterium]